MTQAEIDKTFEQLADAIARDDDTAGRDAVIALGRVVIGSLVRIADAIETLAAPAPKQEGRSS